MPPSGGIFYAEFFRVARSSAHQAIETAMKANKNISTAPASGNTRGIEETTASTGSTSEACVRGDEGLDMVIPSVLGYAMTSILPIPMPCEVPSPIEPAAALAEQPACWAHRDTDANAPAEGFTNPGATPSAQLPELP